MEYIKKTILDEQPSATPVLRTARIEQLERSLLGLVFLITIGLWHLNCRWFPLEIQGYIDLLEGLSFTIMFPLIYAIQWRFFSKKIEHYQDATLLENLKMSIIGSLVKANALLLAFFGFAMFVESLLVIFAKGIFISILVDALGGGLLLAAGIVYFYYVRITGQQVAKLSLQLEVE